MEIKLPSQRLSEPALTKNLEYTTNKFALRGKVKPAVGECLKPIQLFLKSRLRLFLT